MEVLNTFTRCCYGYRVIVVVAVTVVVAFAVVVVTSVEQILR